MEVARAGPHRQIFRGHGLEVVVEHVGLGRNHDLQAPVLAQEVRGQHLDGRCRRARADGADHLREMLRRRRRQIVAVDRGDDHVRQAQLGDRVGDPLRLVPDRARPAGPVRTLQKAQARVQVSPMIMKVACLFAQHSPMLGQPASSQTVPACSRARCGSSRPTSAEPGALTRIQSGLRRTGSSGRCAFSGWRGRASFLSRSRTTAMRITVGRRRPPPPTRDLSSPARLRKPRTRGERRLVGGASPDHGPGKSR